MKENDRLRMLGFYENELTNNLLFYWLQRCEDKVNGGFFNCFDNTGKEMKSTDKYIWSQGRFVWIFASLAEMESDTFDQKQREHFRHLARQGRDFLRKYCLIGENDYRCVYLTNAEGKPKKPEGCDILDASIYADCFVVNAFAKTAVMDQDRETWEFAKRLYKSICSRLNSGEFHTLPYPMEHCYRAHGIPMIMTNVIKEMYDAALIMEPDYTDELKKSIKEAVLDTLDHFVDENYMVREIIRSDNSFIDNIFGTHINPGHTIENIWFILDAMEIEESLNTKERLDSLCKITLNALDKGWDKEYGGIYHYAALTGGVLTSEGNELEKESVLQYALKNTSGKIWWVHSEALYTTLRLYFLTGKKEFWNWYEMIEDYVFHTFPNPDREIREWVQTRDRFGNRKKEAVGLPVKDPYHIMRNVFLIIELLYKNGRRRSSHEEE